MNTSTFIEILQSTEEKKLEFILPDETVLSGDLHITEIQHHNVNSVDCGGNLHSYNETVVQLWINERVDSKADWTTDKTLKIIDIVGQKTDYINDAELLLEFGDSRHPTVRYSIGKIEESIDTLSLRLAVNPTVCKPSLNAGNELVSCC